MLIATVVASAVATVKHPALEASKLLLVRRADPQGEPFGDPFLAVDLVGAGEGELVIVSRGSSARVAIGGGASPTDAAIVGILDGVWASGTPTYKKE